MEVVEVVEVEVVEVEVELEEVEDREEVEEVEVEVLCEVDDEIDLKRVNIQMGVMKERDRLCG